MSEVSNVNEDMEQNKSKWNEKQTNKATVKKIVKTAFLVLAWICLVSTISIILAQGISAILLRGKNSYLTILTVRSQNSIMFCILVVLEIAHTWSSNDLIIQELLGQFLK